MTALREEFGQLRGCLVFIGGANDHGMVDESLVTPQWNKEHHEHTGVWWSRDQASGNLYLTGYHPYGAQLKGCFGSALGRTIQLARTELSRFA